MDLTIDEKYVVISLTLDEIIGKGKLVDYYFAKKNYYRYVTKQSLNEIKKSLFELKDQVNDEMIDQHPYYRQTFMLKQINALIAQVEILTKESIDDYKEIVKQILDIDIDIPDQNIILNYNNQLRYLLNQKGYKGDLNSIFLKWKKDNTVHSEQLECKINEFARVFSEKTYKHVIKHVLPYDQSNELIRSQSVEFEVIATNEGWTAYNYYGKNYVSTVKFNNKVDYNEQILSGVVSHESYPGHHTHHSIVEYLYNKGILGNEASLFLLNTPECTMAEGLADCGKMFINKESEDIDAEIERVYRFLSVEANYFITYKAYTEKLDENSILKLISQYKIIDSNDSAFRFLIFLKNWGYYVPSYKYGRELIEKYYKKFGNEIMQYIYSQSCPTTFKWACEYKKDIYRPGGEYKCY